jgi:hypothetical protein
LGVLDKAKAASDAVNGASLFQPMEQVWAKANRVGADLRRASWHAFRQTSS